MTPQTLSDIVLATSQTAHPRYNKEQHLAWALGILAATVVHKNSNDNVVWARLEAQLELATGDVDLGALDQLARSTNPKSNR